VGNGRNEIEICSNYDLLLEGKDRILGKNEIRISIYGRLHRVLSEKNQNHTEFQSAIWAIPEQIRRKAKE